ncbi:unnamed protein product [Notodromas monacha]|uniref:Coatomer subunit epsilon n=1 Tax=Notodromas monacha TaxID=399045 RepID=A0A7R9GAX8_9CRUS|nr:unnamed protein product [Notodromas monacha]CAG0915930.1 unnamed protein product [Notodromas monacha]
MPPSMATADKNEPDELFDVRNAYHVGNYQQCITEANKVNPSSVELKVEKDVFMYRAYIAQRKFAVVLGEINLGSSPELLAVRRYAEYLSANSEKKYVFFITPRHTLGILSISCSRRSIVEKLEQDVKKIDANSTYEVVLAATIFTLEEMFEVALRLLHNAEALDRAMVMYILLKMNRPDLARKELKNMQDKDDDASLTQLAQGWLNLSSGGDKLQDAYYVFQEMADKYGSSPLLLNGQACALIGQGKFEEAESALQESLEKDPNNADTLVNMIVLSQSQGKAPEVANRYLNQLKDSHAEHPFVKAFGAKESDFERVTKLYAPSVVS